MAAQDLGGSRLPHGGSGSVEKQGWSEKLYEQSRYH